MDIRRHSRHYHRDNPSFSSTLLDAIYRSIDESNNKEDEQEMAFCRETTKKKHSGSDKGSSKACMIEKWIEEKHTYEKEVSARKKSMAEKDSYNHLYHRHQQQPVLLNSSSSSSESSSGGGFSSSESESVYNTAQIPRPKPIKTSVSVQSDKYQTGGVHNNQNERNSAPKRESSSFTKTKSKALKIYSDLKKAKQPISPGGRLATFLNSIFSTAGNAKKAKISSYDERKPKSKSEQNSTCSSASSFSRSCLSKTPSSRGKLNTETKRSVRFYPVSVIVGEDSRPCGQKNVYENINQVNPALISAASERISHSHPNPISEDLKLRVMSESRRVEEVARELLMNYQKKQQKQEEHYDDDGESCASSDLFELDNLSAIGIERYCEELPVYETTHLSTNRAIVNGLIL